MRRRVSRFLAYHRTNPLALQSDIVKIFFGTLVWWKSHGPVGESIKKPAAGKGEDTTGSTT
jgi:hypothetical protein